MVRCLCKLDLCFECQCLLHITRSDVVSENRQPVRMIKPDSPTGTQEGLKEHIAPMNITFVDLADQILSQRSYVPYFGS